MQGTAGAKVVATNNDNNRLDGVTLEVDLDLSANYAHVGIENGLTLNSTAQLTGWSGLLFIGTQTLGGTGTVVFGTSIYNTLSPSQASTT